MKSQILALLTAVLVVVSLDAPAAQAQSFHEGRTVRIIAGLAAGGGFLLSWPS